MADTRRTIVLLIAVLLAALLAGVAVVFLLPNTQSNPVSIPITPLPPENLDTSVLQRAEYTQLDVHLLQQGALPVQPPAAAGKTNPFL